VSKTPPVGVFYKLTEFGQNYRLLSFPFFILFSLKPFWKFICIQFDQNPPNIPLSESTHFPELAEKVETFGKSQKNKQGDGKERSGILQFLVTEKALQILMTTLQMSKNFTSRFSAAYNDPDLASMAREIIDKVIETTRTKFFFDITCILYTCAPLSFNNLKILLPDLNSPTLSTQLQELEEMDIVTRVVLSEVPLRVTYNLTEFGTGLFCMF